MKKALIIIITMLILTMTGCSDKEVVNHKYVFQGENEDWTVVYEVNAKETLYNKDGTLHYDNKSDSTFTATYKKDSSDLATYKNIEIEYKSSVTGGKLTAEIDQAKPSKTYSMKSSSTGGTFEKEDDVIEVTISLDGNIQTMELKTK